VDQNRLPSNAGSTGFLIVIALLVAFGLVVSMMIFLQELGQDLSELPDPPEAMLWCTPDLVDELKSVRGEFVHQSKTWVEINGASRPALQQQLLNSQPLPDLLCLAEATSPPSWQPDSAVWYRLEPSVAQIQREQQQLSLWIWVRRDSSKLAVAQSFVRWLRAFGDAGRQLRGPAGWSFPAGDAWQRAPSWQISLPVELAPVWDARFHEFAALHGIEVKRLLRRDDSALAAFVAEEPWGIVVGSGEQLQLASGLTPWEGGQIATDKATWIRWDGEHAQSLLIKSLRQFLAESDAAAGQPEKLTEQD